MKPLALDKARSRLRIATNALEDVKAATSEAAFDDAWFVFLTAWKGIYTVLEQGAKDSPQSRQWFGGKKAERKRTDYLQYLFIARNDEEHGLEPVLATGVKGSIRLINPKNAKAGEPMHFTWDDDPSGDTGRMELVKEVRGRHLAPVKDRDGTVIEPPWLHNGGDPLFAPVEIAALALTYAEALIAEADALRTT